MIEEQQKKRFPFITQLPLLFAFLFRYFNIFQSHLILICFYMQLYVGVANWIERFLLIELHLIGMDPLVDEHSSISYCLCKRCDFRSQWRPKIPSQHTIMLPYFMKNHDNQVTSIALLSFINKKFLPIHQPSALFHLTQSLMEYFILCDCSHMWFIVNIQNRKDSI